MDSPITKLCQSECSMDRFLFYLNPYIKFHPFCPNSLESAPILVPLPSFFSFPLHSVTAIFFQVPPLSSSSLLLCPDIIPNSSSSHFYLLIILYPSILPFPSFFRLLIRASLFFSNQASFFEIIIYSLLLSFLVLHMTASWVKKYQKKILE